MAEQNFTIYPGKWTCQTCKEEVPTLRCYADKQEITWMCSKKHLSKHSFAKKRKKDYERKV